jgi:hypothetical protein
LFLLAVGPDSVGQRRASHIDLDGLRYARFAAKEKNSDDGIGGKSSMKSVAGVELAVQVVDPVRDTVALINAPSDGSNPANIELINV